MWWGHHGFGWGDFGWGGMLISGLVMLLFWGGLILLVVLAVRYLIGAGSGRTASFGGGSSSDRALEILKERYARGEITKEQFEEMKRDLVT